MLNDQTATCSPCEAAGFCVRDGACLDTPKAEHRKATYRKTTARSELDAIVEASGHSAEDARRIQANLRAAGWRLVKRETAHVG